MPEKLAVVTTSQHLHNIGDVRKQLPNAVFAGQVLGCRADTAKNLAPKVDAFLYVGTGEFHPIRIALDSHKPVFVWNPVSKVFGQLSETQIAAYRKRVQASLNHFYHADTIGVLISTKPGQNNNMITSPTLANKMNPVEQILRRTDSKKYYLFASDTLNSADLENFPFIQCWINLACSRIMDDKIKNLVNWQDIREHEASQ